MGDGSEFAMREQDLIRLLARWGEHRRAGMVELTLLAKATAIIARNSLALDERDWLALMREVYSE
jgi:hypothetical protein